MIYLIDPIKWYGKSLKFRGFPSSYFHRSTGTYEILELTLNGIIQ